ncbi:ABC transporter ATP-binding protein [Paraflavitalea sp. CAU 1676]|uniref:ABC transporter ATP-binding protein n=1 Tax=Paraflavitalea sp. CAU 1676 TaxID=3032598 RepID=UPI0023DCD30F|nr:ABC transporter ATP-binding protein [Paraflavitalea sp. CAU 1676]MDF2187054.1 ABC transporter ATP-binding protein [Paraflavitalea sp. CAU 1676]
MSNPVIKAEHLSKKFILSHETQERYTSLRDVLSRKAKGLLGNGKKPAGSIEEFKALDDVSFEIYQGDRVGIIGRNGAGKSTLLKVLSRITEPSSGSITIRGRVASLLEVGTGFHPELSGRENIFLNGAILGMSRTEIRKKFDEIVAFAEVEKFLDTPVKRYSSGMYVRLAFAVAAHLEPEILIVDEVLAVGDAQFQKKCLGKMEDVSKNEGRTVLFVSHNMGVISQLCKKAILLSKGRLIQTGETRKVIDNYVLNTQANSNSYEVKPGIDKNQKRIYFSRVSTLNTDGVACEDFQFDQNIVLDIGLVITQYDHAAKISFTLQNNNGDYLSTFVEDLSRFYNGKEEASFKIKVPSHVIAPNTYAFRLAIFLPHGTTYDLVEMICPIRIHDSGTDMAMFEGANYGSFFLNYEVLS